jgi:hypothetical protein
MPVSGWTGAGLGAGDNAEHVRLHRRIGLLRRHQARIGPVGWARSKVRPYLAEANAAHGELHRRERG